MKTVLFINNNVLLKLKEKRKLKNFFLSIFDEEGIDIQKLTYIFCTDSYLITLNKAFLKHDTFTDVITFTLSNENEPLVADIYISIQRVAENARKFNESFLSELLRVMIHGVLHLCGYSDKRAKKKALIRRKEDYYLTKYLFHVKRST